MVAKGMLVRLEKLNYKQVVKMKILNVCKCKYSLPADVLKAPTGKAFKNQP